MFSRANHARSLLDRANDLVEGSFHGNPLGVDAHHGKPGPLPVILMRDLGRREPPPLPPARARAPRLVRSTGAPPVPTLRNVFEYGARPAPEATPRAAMPAVRFEEPSPMTTLAAPEPAVV